MKVKSSSKYFFFRLIELFKKRSFSPSLGRGAMKPLNEYLLPVFNPICGLYYLYLFWQIHPNSSIFFNGQNVIFFMNK